MSKNYFLILLCLFGCTVLGQTQEAQTQKARQHIIQSAEKWQLSAGDVQDIGVSSAYVSKHNGVTHVYLQQQYNGIPIHNAISNVHIKQNGEVFYAKNKFVADIQGKINATQPQITPDMAVATVGGILGYTSFVPQIITANRSAHHFVYDKDKVALEDISAKLKYFLTDDQQLRLVWDITFDEASGNDYANMKIDAISGELLDRKSFTVRCAFEQGMYHHHSDICSFGQDLSVLKPLSFGFKKKDEALQSGPQYTVFPFPTESPAHGQRSVVSDDFYREASPFGWHDINGMPGPEFTITRGNNVWAWPARGGNMTSIGNEPNGGPDLIFDYDFDPTQEPQAYIDAATVNLFYSNNALHDFLYAYGFDEEAGNFQANNYGKGGRANDQVNALAQFGANAGQDINNADFTTPSDGGPGRMRMFVWNSRNQSVMKVLEPEGIARNYATGIADFGPQVTDQAVTGSVAIARDNTGNPTLACNPIANGDAIAGKVALVDRGSCFFIQKAFNVEQAGAIACIICNFENSVINMAPGEGIPNPGIPTVMLSSSDCNLIRQNLLIGNDVVVSFVNENTEGPSQLDGTLDNGIVAHELGHGLSNRLTGGPLAAGCLTNNEQMGEGWSDFITLVSTIREGDTGDLPRGIGTFVLNQNNRGQGIRRFPYSTDMNINPLTYDDIIGTTAPHPLGEVWVAMLWDLYWAMVDKYGLDLDFTNPESGNSRAMRLVIDGMRYQGCSPGFADGRDGIIIADELLYGGENKCLIWEVFARRGLGFSSSQGVSTNRNDGQEAYDVDPECLGRLNLVKNATPSIEPGGEIEISIQVGNHTGTASNNVVVTEVLPEGASIVPGSTSTPFTVNGNEVTFQLGDMDVHALRTINYKIVTNENRFSQRIFFDDMENPDTEFDWDFITVSGAEPWQFAGDLPYQGENSWLVYTVNDLDIGLYNFFPVTLPAGNPVLRFFHNYNTEAGSDGGIVEISTDGGINWRNVESEIIRNGYRGKISYNAFTIPNLRAFWGDSQGWRETLIDLSEYAGQDIQFKFRYGTDAQNSARPLAWSIDNIEILLPLFYNEEVCVSADGVDSYCTVAEQSGTLVEAGINTSTNENHKTADLKIFPNPANQQVNLQMRNLNSRSVAVTVLSTDGRIVRQIRQDGTHQAVTMNIPTGDLQSGMYLFKIQTDAEVIVQKVMIQH